MQQLDVLWNPIDIGHLQARNRIYLPAHQVSLPPAEYGAYLAERARGGVGPASRRGSRPGPMRSTSS
jgi:2,4-dienoyl-CoA reductase-like NADH-dependent reductase (Old Yellow Enzyme family)